MPQLNALRELLGQSTGREPNWTLWSPSFAETEFRVQEANVARFLKTQYWERKSCTESSRALQENSFKIFIWVLISTYGWEIYRVGKEPPQSIRWNNLKHSRKAGSRWQPGWEASKSLFTSSRVPWRILPQLWGHLPLD